jgi:hypothetical protein
LYFGFYGGIKHPLRASPIVWKNNLLSLFIWKKKKNSSPTVWNRTCYLFATWKTPGSRADVSALGVAWNPEPRGSFTRAATSPASNLKVPSPDPSSPPRAIVGLHRPAAAPVIRWPTSLRLAVSLVIGSFVFIACVPVLSIPPFRLRLAVFRCPPSPVFIRPRLCPLRWVLDGGGVVLQKQLRSIHPVLEFLAIMIFYFSQS